MPCMPYSYALQLLARNRNMGFKPYRASARESPFASESPITTGICLQLIRLYPPNNESDDIVWAIQKQCNIIIRRPREDGSLSVPLTNTMGNSAPWQDAVMPTKRTVITSTARRQFLLATLSRPSRRKRKK